MTGEQQAAWAKAQQEAFSLEAMERGRCLLEERLSELTTRMAQAQKDMLSASVGTIDVLQDHLMEQFSDLLKTATARLFLRDFPPQFVTV